MSFGFAVKQTKKGCAILARESNLITYDQFVKLSDVHRGSESVVESMPTACSIHTRYVINGIHKTSLHRFYSRVCVHKQLAI